MKIHVELQAYLDQYSPNGQASFDYELPQGATVLDLVKALGIPEELANVVIVGSTNAGTAHPLSENDRVTLIPPLAGGCAF
jgi:molybdopterin converting factor small subunit